MAATSKSYLRRDFYRAIYGLITTYITDTQSPARAVTSWCFSAFPDKDELDTDDFPIVIFDKPIITSDQWTLTKHEISFEMNITVYTAGNKAAEYNNTLTDQIYSIFDTYGYSDLRNDKKLYNVEITGETEDVVLFQGIKVHLDVMTISGRFRHS